MKITVDVAVSPVAIEQLDDCVLRKRNTSKGGSTVSFFLFLIAG